MAGVHLKVYLILSYLTTLLILVFVDSQFSNMKHCIFLEKHYSFFICFCNSWVFTFCFFLHFKQYININIIVFFQLITYLIFINSFKHFEITVSAARIKTNFPIYLTFFNATVICKLCTFYTIKIHFILLIFYINLLFFYYTNHI